MQKNFPTLADAFLNYFDVDLATTKSQRDHVGRVRYRVYCEEFGYKPPENYPDRRETDHYDDYSLHCLITHKSSRRPAGCVRVIHSSEDNSLPIEDNCLSSIYIEYLQTLAENRDIACEFSRLAVDPVFRKRQDQCHAQLGEFDALDCCHLEQRTFSMIGLALLMAGCATARITDREHVFAMMEPTMPRMLRRAGILLQEAGTMTDYHGPRSPYFVTTDLVEAHMRQDLRNLYSDIHDRLSDRYRARGSRSAVA